MEKDSVVGGLFGLQFKVDDLRWEVVVWQLLSLSGSVFHAAIIILLARRL